ncbi:protein FAR1-RELATED SEQUENCE 5-like [Rutidosis leptorrhynchoides]|uniref:protein FAR1-RELATED SEQUENCE 5-like n=1 Tax=Rutidosis leptorrhynchoides TaxID=125765 RepID=UPI003A9A2A72
MSEFAGHLEEEEECDFVPKQYVVGTEIVSESGISHWLPEVDNAYKPVKGTIFDSIDVAYNFYQQYAQRGGFEIRKATQTPARREGFKPTKPCKVLENNERHQKGESHVDTNNMETNAQVKESDSSNQRVKKNRVRPSQRIGCEASFKLRIVEDNKYELYGFVEEHNHCMVHPDYRLHLKTYRKLDNSMKTLLYNFLLAGVGPTAGHRILTKILGGLDKVGTTSVDCRNFKRDIIAYIGKADAQIMVDMLTQRKKCLPNFSFEYFVDDKGVLGGFFWADEYAKRNYSAFGDVVSFDATFRTNKYNMVFIPFTGIDNHKKCVTFGAGMLAKEDAYSYKWLLNCFKTAFPDEPMIVMTDQDPAMKIAVEDVFKMARHRLCMWHIMEKLTTKVRS